MEWFANWFNTPYYHLLYNNRDYVEAENFIQLLLADLQLPQHSKIIDLACGQGRHSVYLNKKGFQVLGLDLSEASIEHNQQFCNDTLDFKVHDMRDPIVGEPVDAVMNLFTSFGYFDDPADDDRVFCSVSNILKPNGVFVLDFLNADFVRNTLVPHEEIQRGSILFKINKNIQQQQVIKDIRFSDEGRDFHFQEKVKLHSFEELATLASKHNLEYVKHWGDYQLAPHHPNSPRCIIIFKKK